MEMVKLGKYEEASKRTQRGVTPRYSDDMVRVGPSAFLAGKGISAQGVYACRKLLKGEVVGEYLGAIITDAEADARRDRQAYMFDVRIGSKVSHVIDGFNAHESSVVRYVNAADHERQQNTSFRQWSGKVYLVVTKTIQKGKELLTWYGKETGRIIA